MASTYSNLKIELIGTGDQSGTWGVTTNTNLGTAIEEAITGSADVTFSSADVTLTLTNTNATQTARNLRLRLTGTSGGARNLTVPNIEKFYIVSNELADDVTVKNTTGTTYTVPAGKVGQVFSTGAGVNGAMTFFAGSILSSAAVILGGAINATPVGNISASTGAFTTLSASSLTLSSPLTVTSGGTGQSSYAVGDLLYANTTTSLAKLADVATGNALISGGVTTAPAWGKIGLTTHVSGTLPVANGGTGVTTSTGTGNTVLSASPTFTGSPLAPTQTAGDNSTKIATTQYVATAITNATGSLGTMSTQNSNAVAITGGTMSGVGITGGSMASVNITSGTITGTTVNSVTVGSNASGTKTISASSPAGGSNGDVWYKI